jgi:ectoine hydroxylase-related dioxygenase (phytanoyl-CoA dioxygenase family)
MAHYPRHVHALSPVLTLQGAIAHGDAPLAAGPTLFLPYSQRYEPGYLAAGLPEFVEYFAARHVQLPLETGDMVFFNPALIHAAGANVTRDVRRLVNLFQVSSAFGRAMESIDRVAMCRALYPVLRRSTMTASGIGNAIAACADGYSFPTDLDRDPPLGGLAPKTQAALMREALAGDWDDERFFAALERQAAARLT